MRIMTSLSLSLLFFFSYFAAAQQASPLSRAQLTSPYSSTPLSPTDDFGIFAGGQYFAQRAQQQTSSLSPGEKVATTKDGLKEQVPLNGLGQWLDSAPGLEPLGEGVFSSGSVNRMLHNGSSVIFLGSFQWTRCQQPRGSCGGGSGFSDRQHYGFSETLPFTIFQAKSGRVWGLDVLDTCAMQ